MKLRDLFLFTLICCPLFSSSQDVCGVRPPTEAEQQKFSWFGNNKNLVQNLRKKGYELPDDYFEQLDRNGNYQGKRLRISPLVSEAESSQLAGATCLLIIIYP